MTHPSVIYDSCMKYHPIQLASNKRPKGPHIMHLSTMCHLFEESAKVDIYVYWSARKKTKLGRGRWDLASCQVSLNSIQRFQRRSRKCISQSEARAAIFFSDRPEKHKLGRGCWDLASCQVLLKSVQWFQSRSRKCLSQSEARAAILFFRSARKHKLGRGRWDLASCQVLLNSVQGFQRRSRKCLSQSEARSVILFFRSARKTQTW